MPSYFSNISLIGLRHLGGITFNGGKRAVGKYQFTGSTSERVKKQAAEGCPTPSTSGVSLLMCSVGISSGIGEAVGVSE